MADFKIYKVNSLPGSPVANAVYLVASGSGVDIYVTDANGAAKGLNVGSGSGGVMAYREVSGATTITISDYTVVFTGTTSVIFTLPNPVTCGGRILEIINAGGIAGASISFNYDIYSGWGGNDVTIENIFNGNSLKIQSSGNRWVRIGTDLT